MSPFWLIVTANYSPRELGRLRRLATMLDKATAREEE